MSQRFLTPNLIPSPTSKGLPPNASLSYFYYDCEDLKINQGATRGEFWMVIYSGESCEILVGIRPDDTLAGAVLPCPPYCDPNEERSAQEALDYLNS